MCKIICTIINSKKYGGDMFPMLGLYFLYEAYLISCYVKAIIIVRESGLIRITTVPP